MKFIDEAIVTVQSGKGGRGCVSFRRERFLPRGGPDGGDGGRGGDVVLVATTRRRTLRQFQFKRQFAAQNGSAGQNKCKAGKSGSDLIIEIPPGTEVKDESSGQTLIDFIHSGEKFVVAKGGRGGLGNTRFKSSTNRAPRFAQPGEPGEMRTLRLELKLLADVGIIGLPNAGKSTLVTALSSARPKIGNYPFTTLIPSLGVVETDWTEPFVVADIPGLIEGAHQGAGLGIRFLRHVERTRILVHLIDVSTIDPESPLGGYNTINAELAGYSDDLAKKPQIVVLNKMDLPESEPNARAFRQAMKTQDILEISASCGDGIKTLISNMVQILDSGHDNE